MSTMNTIIESVKKHILFHGKTIEDHNLNRTVKEIIGHEIILQGNDFQVLETQQPFNIKYHLEMIDIDYWYRAHFPQYNSTCHRRHVVYFNNNDHDNRLQCISLFQVIDDVMIVYQRSSDIEKMADDFRFFVEIRRIYFKDVKQIKIFYGSLHTKINDNG